MSGPTDKPLKCIVDDGEPCPNTCVRQGYCTWLPPGEEREAMSGPTDIRVLLYLLRSDTTSLAWAKERMIEAADEIDRLRAELEVFMASNAGLTTDVLSLRAINADLVAALAGLILHVEELRPLWPMCFDEAPEMKIARKAYQAAAARGEQT